MEVDIVLTALNLQNIVGSGSVQSVTVSDD